MPKVLVSAKIDEDDKEGLAEIAKITNRSQNQHIARAVHDHVMREKEFIAMVQAGQNATEFAEHDKVDNWLASWGTENELDPPKPRSLNLEATEFVPISPSRSN